MQVVDTNRSKASFKRLNKQTLEGSKRSESEASKQQERNKEINCRSACEDRSCAVVRVAKQPLHSEGWIEREGQNGMKTLTGGNDGEVPPVPIPNTVVKLSSAESTWLDTAREDRSLPVPFKASRARLFFLCFGGIHTDIV